MITTHVKAPAYASGVLSPGPGDAGRRRRDPLDDGVEGQADRLHRGTAGEGVVVDRICVVGATNRWLLVRSSAMLTVNTFPMRPAAVTLDASFRLACG